MNQRIKRSSLRKATGDVKPEKEEPKEIKGLAKASPAFKPIKVEEEPSQEDQAKVIARSTEFKTERKRQ